MKIYLFDMDDTIYIHDRPLVYDNIKEDRHLSALLYYCPYPKYIYTNATFGHADVILEKMKLSKVKVSVHPVAISSATMTTSQRPSTA